MSKELRHRELKCLNSCRPPPWIAPGSFSQRALYQVSKVGRHPCWFSGFKLLKLGPSVCPGFGWSLAQWGLQIFPLRHWPSTPNSVGYRLFNSSSWNPELPKRHLTVQCCDKALRAPVTVVEAWKIVMLLRRGKKKATTHKCWFDSWMWELQLPRLEAVVPRADGRQQGSTCTICWHAARKAFICCWAQRGN